MFGRKRSRTSEGATRRRFEAGLLSVMGPAQVGDVNAPVTYEPPAADLLCPRCAQPWDDHEVVRTPSTTIAHCPPRTLPA